MCLPLRGSRNRPSRRDRARQLFIHLTFAFWATTFAVRHELVITLIYLFDTTIFFVYLPVSNTEPISIRRLRFERQSNRPQAESSTTQ